MSGQKSRIKRIELRTHKLLTRRDYLLLAEKWKERLAQFNSTPEAAKADGDEILLKLSAPELMADPALYRVAVQEIAKENPQGYYAHLYYRAIEGSEKSSKVTWVPVWHQDFFDVMKELRAKAKKSKTLE